jgi:hypothetical protein
LLHRLQIAPPEGDPFCARHRAWWDALQVSPTERLHVRHDLATLDQVAEQLKEIDDELRRLSCSELWAEVVTYLMHLPGVGLIVAMTILAAIGDVTRFPTSKKLVGYSGLAVSVHDSGQTHRTGHTLAPRLRAAQVQVSPRKAARNCATSWSRPPGMPSRRMTFGKPSSSGCATAWNATKPSSPSHADFSSSHLHCTAGASVWHVLTERAADHHADPDMVAFKLMTWSWKLTPEQRGGLTTRQFVRYQLLRLGLGHDLTHVIRGGGKYLIAPPDEVLQLKPELHPAT